MFPRALARDDAKEGRPEGGAAHTIHHPVEAAVDDAEAGQPATYQHPGHVPRVRRYQGHDAVWTPEHNKQTGDDDHIPRVMDFAPYSLAVKTRVDVLRALHNSSRDLDNDDEKRGGSSDNAHDYCVKC